MELRKTNIKLPKIDPNNLFKTWKAQIEAILKHHHLNDIAIGVEKVQDLKTEAEHKSWERKLSRAERIIKSTLDSKVLDNLWLHPENNNKHTLYEQICAMYENIPKTSTSLFNPLIFNYKIVYTLELLKQCMDNHNVKEVDIINNEKEDNKGEDKNITRPDLQHLSQLIKKKKSKHKRRRHIYQPYRKLIKFQYIK